VALDAAEPDLAAVRADDVAGDGEADSRPRDPLRGRAGAEEPLEDPVVVLARDADPVVGDREPRAAADDPHLRSDGAALG